ncbi:YitT family protein [Numidum massiliense]|uniref:YitT family protein n=1 Tax=Numidum massiliense TaxID=1522315 RepID=UPI0006D59631|nr:YitT family protein [Numidum massiliense]
MQQHVKNVSMVILGSFIFAFGINYFAIPNHLAEGGVTGITLLLKYLFDWSPALTNLMLNLPLLIIGWRELGRTPMVYTVISTTATSVALWMTNGIGEPMKDDMLLAALYAGVMIGIGIGIIFRFNGTSGGSAIIARLMEKHLGWSVGRSLFLVDLAVVATSAYFLGRDIAMYTIVSLYVGARVIDIVQEGVYSAKAAIIVSSAPAEISSYLIKEMNRGATLLKGRGGFTGNDKEVLYCVVNKSEISRLKKLVHHVDPYAFIVVSDVQEVLGEGFTFTEQERELLARPSNS